MIPLRRFARIGFNQVADGGAQTRREATGGRDSNFLHSLVHNSIQLRQARPHTEGIMAVNSLKHPAATGSPCIENYRPDFVAPWLGDDAHSLKPTPHRIAAPDHDQSGGTGQTEGVLRGLAELKTRKLWPSRTALYIGLRPSCSPTGGRDQGEL